MLVMRTVHYRTVSAASCSVIHRLATVQSSRVPTTPLVSTKHDVSDDDRCTLLASIRHIAPDHTARLRALQVQDSLCTFTHSNEIY